MARSSGGMCLTSIVRVPPEKLRKRAGQDARPLSRFTTSGTLKARSQGRWRAARSPRRIRLSPLRYHPARRAVNEAGAQTLPVGDHPHPLATAPAFQAHHAREEAIAKDLAALAEGHLERTQSSRLLVALMRDAPVVPDAAQRFIERLSRLLRIERLAGPDVRLRRAPLTVDADVGFGDHLEGIELLFIDRDGLSAKGRHLRGRHQRPKSTVPSRYWSG